MEREESTVCMVLTGDQDPREDRVLRDQQVRTRTSGALESESELLLFDPLRKNIRHKGVNMKKSNTCFTVCNCND